MYNLGRAETVDILRGAAERIVDHRRVRIVVEIAEIEQSVMSSTLEEFEIAAHVERERLGLVVWLERAESSEFGICMFSA